MTPLVDAPNDIFEVIWNYTSKRPSWKFTKEQKGIYRIDIYPVVRGLFQQASLLLRFESENKKENLIHIYSHFSHDFFYKYKTVFITAVVAFICLPFLLSTDINLLIALIILYLIIISSILVNDYFATESRKTEVKSLLKEISKNSEVILHQDNPHERIYSDIHLSIETEFVCPVCGAVNKKDEIFCVQCGSQINERISIEDPEIHEIKIICPNCGAVNDGIDVFCVNCDTQIIF